MQRDLEKGSDSEKEPRACNKRLRAYRTTDRTTLPAGERKNSDAVREELEQCPHSVVDVVEGSNAISYKQEKRHSGAMSTVFFSKQS